MEQWEYKTIAMDQKLTQNGTSKYLEKILNEEALELWEFANSIIIESGLLGVLSVILILKRKKYAK
jgi:hypothetical protein